jgi:hypothetical protein
MSAYAIQPPARHARALRIFAIILLVLVLCCGGIITYIYLNFRSMVAGMIRGPVMQQIQTADLPADQKAGITATIDQLSRDFEEDRLSYQQVARIFERLGQGPFFALIEIESARVFCIDASKPDPEKRKTMTRTCQRLQRGLTENRVSTDQVTDALTLIQMTNSDNQRTFKPNLTAREADMFIERAREIVEQANVPDEPYQVDYAGQLQHAVDEALNRQVTTEPAATQSRPAD